VTGRPIGQDQIDHAPRRIDHRHFEFGTPPWIEASEDLFDHECLESVVQAGTGSRVETDAEIGSQSRSDRSQNGDARLDLVGFDPADMRTVDTDDRGKLGEGHARLTAQTSDVLAALPPDAAHPSCSLASDLGSGDRHGHRKADSPYLSVIKACAG
jgi:hypothetical protein